MINPMLMIIDMQKAIDHPSRGRRNNPDAEMRIEQLLKFWREHSLPVLHIKHMSTEPDSHYRPGTAGNDFKQPAVPLGSEPVIEKDTNSAFIRTGLDAMLQKKGISELVIVGVITNNSVEATARNAGNLGYQTVVVADATYTFNKVDFGGKEHTAEDVHNLALANLDGEYARVLSTEALLSLLQSH